MLMNTDATVQPEASGDESQNSNSLAAELESCLANSYVLMMKTQACHWNVKGPLFPSLHEMTQNHYEDLFAAIDEIAERMRALGHLAPNSLAEMMQASTLKELVGVMAAEDMVTELVRDHRAIAIQLRDVVGAAEAVNDTVTADMLTARVSFHEKTAWMLSATVAR